MAVSIPAGFLVINTDPIDGRMLVTNAAARKNTSTYDQYNSYHGLLVYEQSTNKLFALKDPTNVTSDSSWEELGSSGSGGGTLQDIMESGSSTTIAITGSDISASGDLFANLTENSTATFKTVVYDESTGKFFRTGSYGSSGGGGIPASPLNSIQFNNGGTFGGDPKFVFESTTGLTKLSGSLQITGSTNDIFLVKSGSIDLFKITSSGAIVFGDLQHTPPPIAGGLFYSSSDFYVGIE